MEKKSLFIFGLGYTSQAIAKEAIRYGFSVAGTCRTEDKKNLLKEKGIEAFLFDEIAPELIAGFTHILSSVPPQENGDVILPKLPNNNAWLGYLSTTGVYGDHAGEWVDENSELRPNNERLHRRIEAAKKWRDKGAHIFRLAGIYGTGRSVLNDIRSGKVQRIDKEGQVFSRIHVDDIAQVVLASMENPNPKTIYNLCDNEPAPAHEVVAFACNLLGKEVPPLIPFEQAELSPMGREFYSANRRVDNEKIKKELGINLLYPTYREGLQAILSTEQAN